MLLPLTALPFLYFLIFKRKPVRIHFSSLFLIMNIAKKTRRKNRIKDILLMIIRTLLIMLTILLFAGPYTGSNPEMDPSKRNVLVMYFDTSPSMGDIYDGNALIDFSRDLAVKLLQTAGSDDLFYIMTSDPEEKFYGNSSDAVIFISGTELYGRERDPEEIINEAENILFEYPDRNRMMLFLTDGFTQKEFPYDNDQLFPAGAFIVMHDTGHKSHSGILSADLDGKGELQIDMISSVPGNYNCEVFFDGMKIYSGGIILNEPGIESFSVNIPEERKTFSSVLIRSDNALNNIESSFYMTIPETEQKKILVTGRKDSQSVKDIQSLARVSSTQFDLEILEPEEAGSVLFDDYDLILITEITGINSFIVSNYKRFLENGGSLFFVAGDKLNLNDYNSRLVTELGFPSIKSMFRAGQGSYSGIEIKSVEHSIFKGVFHEKTVVPSTVEIYSFYLMDGEGWNSLIEAQDHPLLLEREYGAGRIFFLATGTGPEDSNIMRNGIAIPIFLNSFSYLTGKRDSNPSFFLSGDTAGFDKHLYLVPEGRPLKPNEDVYSRVFRLRSPGLYDLYDSDGSLYQKIAVNSEREDRVDYTSSIKKMADTRFFKGFEEKLNINDLFYGASIFRHFIILISVLIILELIVVRIL